MIEQAETAQDEAGHQTAPRICKLPGCGKEFQPKQYLHPPPREQLYCCRRHERAFALAKERAQAEVIHDAALDARMAPRLCKLPGCGALFIPKRPQDWKSEFCCKEHQKEFWVQANRIAAAAITGQLPPQPVHLEAGISHRLQVLAILERNVNRWVEHPRLLLPSVMWNCRVAELRKQGCTIERRRIGERPRGDRGYFKAGSFEEYQYRLVRE